MVIVICFQRQNILVLYLDVFPIRECATDFEVNCDYAQYRLQELNQLHFVNLNPFRCF